MPSSLGIEQSIRIASELVWPAAATASSVPGRLQKAANCEGFPREARGHADCLPLSDANGRTAAIGRFRFASAVTVFACNGTAASSAAIVNWK